MDVGSGIAVSTVIERLGLVGDDGAAETLV